ncbi:hypothetical protein FQN50_003599 [Emmonsiellopsis sp. PD_5]|nr:hypothetical protein FQN50_003599 [Emmonsiellopsis sp. PD_5]
MLYISITPDSPCTITNTFFAQLSPFEAFNGIAEGLESEADIDLTTDITSYGNIITQELRQRPNDAQIDPKEIGTKDESRANGDFLSSAEDASSMHAISIPYSAKPRYEGETDASDTGKPRSSFKEQCGRSDARPMETMVAVVVPASSHCHHEDPATSKGYQSRRRVPQTRQHKGRPKSMPEVSNSQDCNLPGRTTQNVDDNWSESSTSRPSDNTDDDYTTSSDDGEPVKKPSKRRKLSSRSSVTTSCRLRPRSLVAGAIGHRRELKWQPRSVRSVAVTERSTSLTCAGHAPPVADQTLSPRQLSPEDVSAVVSALTEKLLDILRGSSMDAMRAADEGVAVVDTESASDDETIGEQDRKRPRWTREDDERLKNLKTRGWRWWEIKQQFPRRTLSALQQRWSLKLQAIGSVASD